MFRAPPGHGRLGSWGEGLRRWGGHGDEQGTAMVASREGEEPENKAHLASAGWAWRRTGEEEEMKDWGLDEPRTTSGPCSYRLAPHTKATWQ